MFKTKSYFLATIFFCGVLVQGADGGFSFLSRENALGMKRAYASVGTKISGDAVDLQADKLEHNQNGQSITATGDVILKQSGKTVKADKIIYNLQEDTVIATGHVVFTDVNGDRHYADRFEFNNALKNGFIEEMKSFLADGSRFIASSGQHVAGNKTIMTDARYTPCEVCEANPEAEPLWQIRASEVEHDKDSKMISYHNARFEIKGVPVAYMPYFSHPDGSVKRKSGFLAPTAGYNSDLGAFVEESYYWSIAPDKDLTFGIMAMSQKAPLVKTEWRQRWENASLKAIGSLTYSERTDDEAGVEIDRDEELRGHLKTKALWDINNKWRSGANIYLASDEQYLRQYDFDDQDVLENELYVERFSGRNYAAGRLLAFKDVRVDEERDEDQPNILPEIEANFIGEPNSMPIIGGRWNANTSIIGLVRDNDAQDVTRGHVELGWQRKLVSQTGFITILDASMQGSIYNVNDRTGYKTNSLIKGNSTENRAFAYINAETSYPLVKTYKKNQAVIEPVVSVMLAPDIDTNNIPNEDSQDVQIDALGLFEADRFPGIDGVEDQSHITYGMRTGLYDAAGSYGDIFIGQSYQFDENANIFSSGSGLDEQSSDIVGEVRANYKNDYTLDYRFQLDNDSLASQRHEIDATAHIAKLSLSSRYLFAKAIENLDDEETREQVYSGASYYIDDKWRVYGGARHDLGDNPGLRKANLGVVYTGQCISWSLAGERTLTDDSSGDSGAEIFLRVGFKNLGELQTSGVQLGRNSE
ncbi:MAG: LPS-assembly protein LptD [Alphaproteobacteria bacterium]|nr:LPS-assembly protein LptD [Alphaproteobacteria bacterium]